MRPDLWFDVYPYNNPKAGARLVRLTSQQLLAGSLFRVERRGTGSGRIVLNSGQAEFTAANLHEENLVEVGDANVSATDPLGGFFLHRGDLEIISADEQGGEDFPIGGPGLLAYLAREIMWSHTYYSQDIDPSIAFAFGMDPFDDLWRLSNAGTGSTLGAMLWRAVWEGQHFPTGPYQHRHGDGVVYTDTHVDDRPSSAIPDLAMDFDENLDSDGNAWAAYNGAFSARMKQQILAVALELIGKGMDVQMRGGRQLTLSAYNSYGRDFRGSAFGAGVVRFAHGVNIANPARRAIEAGLNGSRALVGSNDVYALVNSPVGFNVVRSVGLDSDAEDPGALAIDGAANLRAREAGSDVPALKVLYGNDPASGLYQFAPPEVGGHAWVGDLVTIHRGTGAFQWNNADARIEAITFELTDEKLWDDPTVEFGAVYRSADERGRAAAVQAIANKPHGPHTRLCLPHDLLRGLSGGSLKASGEQATPSPAPKSNACDGDDTTPWGSADGEPSIGVAGEWWAANLGARKVVGRYRIRQQGGGTPDVQNVATEVRIYGTTDPALWSALPTSGKLSDPGAAGWRLLATYTGSLAFSDSTANFTPGSAQYVVFWAASGGTLDWDVETFELWSYVGTSKYAARCDHSHAELDEAIHTIESSVGQTLADTEAERTFIISAHRGDIGSDDSYPENTVEGFIQAARKGAHRIEVDAQWNADQTFYAIHDTTVDRTTDGTGNVADKTDAQMDALNIDGSFGWDSGRHGTSLNVPTLEAVLDAVRPYDIGIDLDLKTSSVAAHTALADLVVARGIEHLVNIRAESLDGAAAIKAVSRRILVGAFTTVTDDPHLEDDVDIWWAQRSEVASLATVTARAPDYVQIHVTTGDGVGVDEEPWLRDQFSYGVRSYMTNNLEQALAVRQMLLGIDYLNDNGEIGGAAAFDELTDVTAPSPSTGEMPRWNGSAWVNDSGLICVDPGSIVVDAGTPFGVTLTTNWGVDGTTPYYDDTGALVGDEAALFYDPLNDRYTLITYDF